ncbi:hypothetical protein COOONC_07800 [Cooperia oncophora]
MCDEDKEYIRRAEEGLQLEKNRLRLGEEYFALKEKIKADRVRLRTELSSLVDLYECQVEVAESALDRLNRAKIGYFGLCSHDEPLAARKRLFNIMRDIESVRNMADGITKVMEELTEEYKTWRRGL